MRLLQVATIPAAIQAFLLPFAAHFRGLGWVVDCAAAEADRNNVCVEAFDAAHHVPWSRNPLHPKNVVAYRVIRRILEEGSYDLVHVHTPVAAFVTRAAIGSMNQAPTVIYTAHGFHFLESGNSLPMIAYRAAEQIAARWTDMLVVMNSEDYRSAQKYELMPLERLVHIPGIGIDLEEVIRSAETGEEPAVMRDELGIPPNSPVILMIAEFTPNKRHIDAVEAMAELDYIDPSPHLVLVGTGKTVDKVQRRVADLGLGDRTHFLGYRNDVPSLMRMANALILVSDREGLPRSIMEAMALGLPVVGSRIRGIEDLLSDGAGMFVGTRRPKEIAAALAQILAPTTDNRHVVQTARRRVENYSISSVISAYEDVYRRASKQLKR